MAVRSEIVHLQMAVSISSTVFCITSCALFCLIECCDSSSRMVHCFRCQSLVDGLLSTADWLKQFCFDLLIGLLHSLIFYPPLVSVLPALIQQVYVQGYDDLILLTFDLAYFFHSVWSPDCVMSSHGKLIIIFLSQVGHLTISKIMDCPSLAHYCHKPRLACSVYAKVTYVLKSFILGSWWSDWILEVWKQQVLVGRGRISFYSLLCLSELVSESCLLFCNWLRYGLTLSSFVPFEVSCLPLIL